MSKQNANFSSNLEENVQPWWWLTPAWRGSMPLNCSHQTLGAGVGEGEVWTWQIWPPPAWLPPGASGLLPGRGASVTSTQGRERQVNLIQGIFNPRRFLYPASDKLALCEWQMSHFLTDWSPRCVRLLQATRPQCSSDVYYCAVQNFSPSLSFSLMDVTEVLNTLTARPLLPENDEVCTLTNCFLRKIKYLSQV